MTGAAKPGLARRGLIGGFLASLCLVGSAAAKTIRRMSKAKALYQDHPQDIRACSTCTLFVAPAACKAVIGKVSPEGWCKLYDMAD